MKRLFKGLLSSLNLALVTLFGVVYLHSLNPGEVGWMRLPFNNTPPIANASNLPTSLLPPASQGAQIDESRVSNVLYVDNAASTSTLVASGSQAQPFTSIQQALTTAKADILAGIGVRVMIKPGIYREELYLEGNGIDNAPLIIEPTEVVHKLTWEQLEEIDRSLEDFPSVRLAYLDGTREIMPISAEYEDFKSTIARLRETYLDETAVRFYRRGGLSYDNKELGAKNEPDESYNLETQNPFPDRRYEWQGETLILKGGLHSCYFVDATLIINADGSVAPCCSDAQGLLTLGDANTQSIAEIFQGQPLQELRRKTQQERQTLNPAISVRLAHNYSCDGVACDSEMIFLHLPTGGATGA